jgi:hypothetical protein
VGDEQAKAIRAVESAFGKMVKDCRIEGRWITWRSVHRVAALRGFVVDAERQGARGMFVRENGTGRTLVGCLNPGHRE